MSYAGLMYTWLKFDLSSLSEGLVGVYAVLELYTNQHVIQEPHNVTAHFCLDCPWSEDTLTADNDPACHSPILDLELVSNEETMYAWIVTEAVEEALTQNSTDLTLILRHAWGIGHDGSIWIEFNSKELGKKMPELTLSWTDIPEFPSLHILQLFMITTLLAVFVCRRKKSKV